MLRMPIPLLQTKLYAPPPRPHLVPRDHLLDRLRNQDTHPLTLVCAPAGFGKTTLVSTWINASAEYGVRNAESSHTPNSALRTPHSIAWLSLDEDDNDPTRFLTYVIVALQRCQAAIGETALALLATPQAPPIKTILTLLINELGTLTAPLTLVLDDYHVISTQPIHEVLIFLIDHLPSQLYLIITSRIDPPLPLARWRVRNQLVEVRADDLRFSPQETATFLNDVPRAGSPVCNWPRSRCKDAPM
jgi:LuxR family transcriptional regulator, maltose regulon positive regulatory protein